MLNIIAEANAEHWGIPAVSRYSTCAFDHSTSRSRAQKYTKMQALVPGRPSSENNFICNCIRVDRHKAENVKAHAFCIVDSVVSSPSSQELVPAQ
jgi:hypothetical protein